MISPDGFLAACRQLGIRFFTGVPDSLLQDLCACLSEQGQPDTHVTAANEGGAVALAAGHYLATHAPALVYMQNSGQGNAVNPLLSLADPEVYGIPMVLLVGWRGEPEIKDEPQHVKQGRVTRALFAAMEIPAEVLAEEDGEMQAQLSRMVERARTESRPVALLVRKGTFTRYEAKKRVDRPYSLVREAVIAQALKRLPRESVFVSSTGHISRELYECRMRLGQGMQADFLTVGSMGHASQIALGIARARADRTVCCLDGDGAVLMQMGGLALVGQSGCRNFRHIVLNNGMHGSVGGQATVGFDISMVTIAQGCGYPWVRGVATDAELESALGEFAAADGPAFLEIRVASAVRDDLGRPKSMPEAHKRAFMAALGKVCCTS